MLLLEKFTVQEAIDKAVYLCDNHLNPLFPPPMRLEFEKVYYPYVILTKKRYFGLLWTSANCVPKKDVKGLATRRRDFCGLVGMVLNKVMDLILWSNDIAAALQYVQDTLQQLLEGTVQKELLVIRRELKKRPADYATPSPHSVVAAKMQKLNPDMAPKLGERVPFVISQGSLDISQRAEPPDTPDLQIDTQYYLEHQLKNHQNHSRGLHL